MAEDLITIKCFSDNHANSLSQRDDQFEISRADWAAMTLEDREKEVREYLASNEHFSWWFEDPLEEKNNG